MYYIIGFLGKQAEEHSESLKKGSGKQLIIEHFSKSWFAFQNTGEDVAVQKLIEDSSVPTNTYGIEPRTPSRPPLSWQPMLEFFSCIDYIWVCKGCYRGQFHCWWRRFILNEILTAFIDFPEVMNQFLNLCKVETTSEITSSDHLSCIKFCMLVFGRARAKDLSLKYNNNLYRGNMQLSWGRRLLPTQATRIRRKLPSTRWI